MVLGLSELKVQRDRNFHFGLVISLIHLRLKDFCTTGLRAITSESVGWMVSFGLQLLSDAFEAFLFRALVWLVMLAK